MAYETGGGIWNGVFAVPNALCDKHIRLASGLAVKVLLLCYRHGGSLGADGLAAMLGQPAPDVRDALTYWIDKGLVRPAGEDEAPETAALPPAREAPGGAQSTGKAAQPPPPPQKEPERGEKQRIETITTRRPRLTTGEINELAAGDKNVTYLLQETQSVLGKPLSPVASGTVASLYSYSGMRPDLILMLVQYCASIGKSSTYYIERVADDWLEREIDTHEKAEAEILRLTEQSRFEGRVRSAFGIAGRSLVTREKQYIRAWKDEYQMDMPLVVLAYERAVEMTGKLSFHYINGILKNWHETGVKTPAEALAEQKARKQPKQKDKPKEAQASYDMGELEKMISGGEL